MLIAGHRKVRRGEVSCPGHRNRCQEHPVQDRLRVAPQGGRQAELGADPDQRRWLQPGQSHEDARCQRDLPARLAGWDEGLLRGERGDRQEQHGPQRLLYEPRRDQPREGGPQRPPGVLGPGRPDHRLPQERIRPLQLRGLRHERASTSTTSRPARPPSTPTARTCTICTISAGRRTANGSWRPCTAAWASSTRTSPSRPRARRCST